MKRSTAFVTNTLEWDEIGEGSLSSGDVDVALGRFLSTDQSAHSRLSGALYYVVRRVVGTKISDLVSLSHREDPFD